MDRKTSSRQPPDSHLQHYLEALWNAAREETGGRFDVTVYPSSMGIADAGTVLLRKVISGEIEFHVLMGNVFGLGASFYRRWKTEFGPVA